jgi:cytidyltransferase-like protein
MMYGRIGVIGRFKPLHLGGAAMLEAVCENAEHAIIGIGSAGPDYKYNMRNPFTPLETREMLDAHLSQRHSNYEIIEIPDFAHIPQYSDGSKWKEQMTQAYGKLDCFVTANPFVSSLLRDTYEIIAPGTLIPPEKWTRLRATEVRMRMAQGTLWEDLVPTQVASYIKEHGLDNRFRREFGLETIASCADYTRIETVDEEREHAQEGI